MHWLSHSVALPLSLCLFLSVSASLSVSAFLQVAGCESSPASAWRRTQGQCTLMIANAWRVDKSCWRPTSRPALASSVSWTFAPCHTVGISLPNMVTRNLQHHSRQHLPQVGADRSSSRSRREDGSFPHALSVSLSVSLGLSLSVSLSLSFSAWRCLYLPVSFSLSLFRVGLSACRIRRWDDMQSEQPAWPHQRCLLMSCAHLWSLCLCHCSSTLLCPLMRCCHCRVRCVPMRVAGAAPDGGSSLEDSLVTTLRLQERPSISNIESLAFLRTYLDQKVNQSAVTDALTFVLRQGAAALRPFQLTPPDHPLSGHLPPGGLPRSRTAEQPDLLLHGLSALPALSRDALRMPVRGALGQDRRVRHGGRVGHRSEAADD